MGFALLIVAIISLWISIKLKFARALYQLYPFEGIIGMMKLLLCSKMKTYYKSITY